MFELSHQELLSAFLDGEATAEERLTVEQMLANDSELSNLLSQWREVGEVLRSGKPATSLVDFSDCIMQRIRQETPVFGGGVPASDLVDDLIRDSSSQDPAGSEIAWPSVANPAISSGVGDSVWHKRWQLGLVSLASLAAGWLLAAFIIPGGDREQPLASVSPRLVPFSASEFSERNDGALKSNPDLAELAELSVTVGGIEASGLRKRENRWEGQPMAQSPESVMARALTGDDLKTADPGVPVLGAAEPSGRAKVFESANSMAMDATLESSQPAATDLVAAAGLGDFNDFDSIEQLYFVDFKTDDPPLAVVSEIFTRNGILILSEPVEGWAQPDLPDSVSEPASANQAAAKSKVGNGTKPDGLNHLQAYSAGGIEAVYVVATREQLENAIQQLTNKADVSGFHLPPGLAASLLNYDPGVSSADASATAVADQPVFPHGFQPMEQLIAEERSILANQEQQLEVPSSALRTPPADGAGPAGVGRHRAAGVFHLEGTKTPGALSPLTTAPDASPLAAFPKVMAKARQLQPFAALPAVSALDERLEGPETETGSSLTRKPGSGTELADERGIEESAPKRAQVSGKDQDDAGAMVKFLLLIKTRLPSSN